MENKEIMEKLLDNNHPSAKSDNQIVEDSRDGDGLSISRIRVVTAKYKVYLFLLLIFICILLFETIPTMKDRYNSRKSSYNQVKSQLISVENQIKDAQKEEMFLNEIVSNEDNLKNCLNKKSGGECSSLPDSWQYTTEEGVKYDYSVPLSYLQVHSLYNEKMSVDEKKVLKNLNEYLIKQDISGTSRTRVGDILRISIGDPTPIKGGDQHFFQVPVNVSIKFASIDDLIGFLYNVEKKMVDNRSDRILYKIQTVSYDIISNDEPQITEIGMLAYYYYDDRFENMEEISNEALDENLQTEIISDDEISELEQELLGIEDVQNSSNSEGSFLDKIFNS